MHSRVEQREPRDALRRLAVHLERDPTAHTDIDQTLIAKLPVETSSGGLNQIVTLASPGVLGGFIGIGVVLATALLVWDGPRQLRRLAVVTIVVSIPGMYFTLTRGPIVATVAVVFLVLMTRPGSRLLAFVLLILATAILGSTWSRLSSSTVYRDRVARTNTVEIRAAIDRISLQLAERRPIFGWGYGSFDRVKELGTVTGRISRTEVLASTSHNTFLTILVEHGADINKPGQFGWTALHAATLSSPLKRLPKMPTSYTAPFERREIQ
jgi:O-antigen ligase